MKMRLLAQRYSLLLQAAALAPLIALVAPIDRAEAACDATSPVDNTVITCTGATVDANGTTGFGSTSDTGNTYNIVAGASVTGTREGLAFDRGTVNNSGTISAGGFFGTASNSVGISADTVNVTGNTGTISGGFAGIDAITLANVVNADT